MIDQRGTLQEAVALLDRGPAQSGADKRVVLGDPRTLQSIQGLLPQLLGADAAARISTETLQTILRTLAQEVPSEQSRDRDLLDVMSSVIDRLGLSRTLRDNGGDQVNVLLDILDGIKVDGAGATMGKIKQAVHDGRIRGLFEGTPIVNQHAGPGRNARCPCGSGRKYKQCCLGKKR